MASGITGGTARHSSTSGNEQNHDKSSQKQRWRSEAAEKENRVAFHCATDHHKTDNSVEESRIELMKQYPVYIGPTGRCHHEYVRV